MKFALFVLATVASAIKIGKEAEAKTCKAGDNVGVNYTGKLEDGTVFDSNTKHGGGAPFNFALGEHHVIKCWEEGVALMTVGEKQTLTCPPEKAYGAKGAGGVIPPNATLTFEVELLNCGTGGDAAPADNDEE